MKRLLHDTSLNLYGDEVFERTPSTKIDELEMMTLQRECNLMEARSLENDAFIEEKVIP